MTIKIKAILARIYLYFFFVTIAPMQEKAVINRIHLELNSVVLNMPTHIEDSAISDNIAFNIYFILSFFDLYFIGIFRLYRPDKGQSLR